jgi:hypothetical protein
MSIAVATKMLNVGFCSSTSISLVSRHSFITPSLQLECNYRASSAEYDNHVLSIDNDQRMAAMNLLTAGQ